MLVVRTSARLGPIQGIICNLFLAIFSIILYSLVVIIIRLHPSKKEPTTLSSYRNLGVRLKTRLSYRDLIISAPSFTKLELLGIQLGLQLAQS